MLPILRIGYIKFYTFPVIISFSFLACVCYYINSFRYHKEFHYVIIRSFYPVILSAAIGGRLLSLIVLTLTNNGSFFRNIIFGGSVFYGGLTGAILGLYIFCRKRNHSFFACLDVYATLLPLGHSVARLGCFLNGCCYGRKGYIKAY